MQASNARFGLILPNDSANISYDSANIGNSTMISDQDVQAYQRDGVIVVPEVLDASTLTRVRSVIARSTSSGRGARVVGSRSIGTGTRPWC